MTRTPRQPDEQYFDELNEIEDWKNLHALSTSLLKPADLQVKMRDVLSAVVKFQGTTRGIISIYDPKADHLTIVASCGMSQSTLERIEGMRPGEAPCGVSFVRRQQVIVADFLADPAYACLHEGGRTENIRAVFATPLLGAEGECLGVMTVYFDAPYRPTERQIRLTDICARTVALFLDRDRSEQALRQERDRRNDILAGMAEGLCIVDHDFRVIEMNAAAIRINKRPFHEMVGKSHWELWPDTADSEVGALYRRAMKERIPVALENRWVDPAGNAGWFELSAQPIEEGLALYIRDISARKIAEQAVVESEARYRALAEKMTMVIWRTDPMGKIAHEMPGWTNFSGQSFEQYAGDGWADIVHPDDRGATMVAWRQAIESGEDYRTAYRLRRHDGTYRHMLVCGTAIMNSDGQVREWIGLSQDITELREVEERLALANTRKDEFLAILGHELRSPLSATKMAGHLLETPTVTPARVAHAGQVINRQVGHMSRLIEDLLDISRVSRGLLALHKAPVDMRDVVNAAVEQLRPLILKKRHWLDVKLPATACMVFGDHTRLVQIVGNLVGNSARYTPELGSLTVTLALDATTVRLAVTDNGIGIEPALLPCLFDIYTQGSISSERQTGGLGLGLALVKSLAQLHGAVVTAESAGRDLGSTFQMVLPLHS